MTASSSYTPIKFPQTFMLRFGFCQCLIRIKLMPISGNLAYTCKSNEDRNGNDDENAGGRRRMKKERSWLSRQPFRERRRRKLASESCKPPSTQLNSTCLTHHLAISWNCKFTARFYVYLLFMIKLKRCDGMCLILREYFCSPHSLFFFFRIYFRGSPFFEVSPQNADSLLSVVCII